ncbi:hypothetical protein BN1708_001341, partial [Verticillium longisporum]
MARHRIATLTPNIDAAESRPPLHNTGKELALYVSFADNEGFVKYESTDLAWRQDTEAEENSPLSTS